MSAAPDLERIKAPEKEPSNQPDPDTAAEETELRRKPLTPTEREAAAHQAHLGTLNGHITGLCGKKERLLSELNSLRQEVTAERQKCADLAVRHTRLESITSATNAMNVLGALMNLGASAILGIAGSWPGISDGWKLALSSAGASMAICAAAVIRRSHTTAQGADPGNK